MLLSAFATVFFSFPKILKSPKILIYNRIIKKIKKKLDVTALAVVLLLAVVIIVNIRT
jgi:hypothetical protein